MLGRFGPIARTTIGVLISVVIFATVAIPSAAGAPAFASGYTVIQASFDAQPQWKRILVQAAARTASAPSPWQDLVSGLRSEHPLRQLDAVNRYFNRVPYAEDGAVYGTNDYWATPEEFLRRNVGDCEDYSIAKYTVLRALGWDADALRIVIIRDHKFQVNHAVLAAQFDGHWYYLDNRASRVLEPRDVPFYQPVYALNENDMSVFVKAKPTLEVAAQPAARPGRPG